MSNEVTEEVKKLQFQDFLKENKKSDIRDFVVSLIAREWIGDLLLEIDRYTKYVDGKFPKKDFQDGRYVGAEPYSKKPYNLKKCPDPVHHPSHYTDGKIEVIDFIEDKKMCFHLGSATQYISRAGKKDADKEKEDLEKAIWYIERKIKSL